ncbi:hypothetical protein [Mycetocola reblochoni]|uniref:Acyl-CoA dehydrogenase n=2 Tax=Mycetocola reblochoni TaxID=331618 RepID=A0A3L6ZSI5_9MICO|nr:hypothetical protein [Mycetocola reblochoni]RLP70916.1 hypothetical protein D9V30_00325 [Mycetocola reblochoni]SJN24547.1 Acyl-CoA dehydrogenase; probable dibenzothiophene desulfurization enzyme [Mycetocola reblochoni REB411]
MTSPERGRLAWAETAPGVPELLAAIRRASVEDAPAVPARFIDGLRSSGFGRLRLPVEDGGLGGDVVDLVDAIVAVASADPSLAQSWRTHVLATERHVSSPQGERRERWLGRIAGGAMLGGGWTEADGSGTSVFTTRLRSDESGLTLSGRKFYSTGSRYADWLEYSAVDEAGELVIAAIRADNPGLTLLDDWTGFGQRATASGTTILDGAVVDPGDVAPFDSQHLGIAGWQQLILLAVLAGIAEGARIAAAELVSLVDRAHGSSPVAVLEGYARISSAAAASRELLRAVARRADDAHRAIVDGDGSAAELADAAEAAAFRAQAVIVDQVVDAADLLMRLPAELADPAEGERLRRVLALDRFWRNARTVGTHNPVLHRLRGVAERELYGLPRIGDPEQRLQAQRDAIAARAEAEELTVVRIPAPLSAALAADRDALRRVATAFADRRGALFQFDEAEDGHFDAGVAIAGWLHLFPRSWFAVGVAEPEAAGHPYNVARRIASLERLSGGRLAWVWQRPATGERDADRQRVVQQLLRSWPEETIAADRGAPAFAETEPIRRIGADGVHRVAGPLNVPSSPQHLPVIVGHDGDAADPQRHVDLVVDGERWLLPGSDEHALALARTVRATTVGELVAAAERLPREDAPDAGTLRARLRLPFPTIAELPGASARFPSGSETESS